MTLKNKYFIQIALFLIFFKQHIKYGIPLNFEFRLQTEEGLRWLHIKGNYTVIMTPPTA